MGRARGLAGGGAALVAILAVVEHVVGIPLVGTPLEAGQLLTGILHLALIGAELLAQLHGAGGADLDALAAGHALLLVHVGAVGGGGEIRRVEVLAGAQSKADADVAVAQAEDLVGAVDVGGLMDVAVLFGALADDQSLFLGDGTALAGFHQILGKIAQADAAVVLDLAGALAVEAPGVAAGAVAHGELALVLVQPVGDVLNGHGFVLVLNRFLHGQHVHADAVAAGGYQMGFALQGKEGHLVEAVGQLGILLHLPGDHVGHLGDAGDEELDVPLLLVLGVLPVVLDDAVIGGVGQQLHNALLGFAGQLRDLRGGLGLAQLHLEHDLRDLVVGAGAVEDDVLGVGLRQFLNAKFVGDSVSDHFAQVKQNLSCHVISPFRI